MAEHMTPVVAKVLPEEKAAFAAATQLVGTTPSNAIRMFIAAFNRCGTFPFDISQRGLWRCARFSSTMTVPNCRHLGTFFFCRQLRNVPKCRVLRRLACSMRWRGRLPVLALSLPI